jgi:mRNA interferase RelE/StbE
MKYTIRISRIAAKELQAIPAKMADKIIDAIYSLENNPRPSGHKKLKGQKAPVYRIRIGDYRVVYLIDDVIRIVDVHKVGHRRDIYE